MGRKLPLIAGWCAAALLAVALPASSASADPAPRIDLRVLVVDDGGAATGAIAAQLDAAGTPFTTVDLEDAGRPVIDAAFLGDTVDGRPRAKFQAVVLPDDNPFGAGSAEMAALTAYEKQFGIPQVDAYTYAKPAVGLNYPQNPGYMGSLDGVTARVTDAGKAASFGYLDGAVPFEDNSPTVSESYGYLAVPLAQQQGGARFTTYVDAPIPGTSQRGALVGEYARDGRRELVVTFVYNPHQRQFRLLARGVVEWLTQGVHLGADRNYLSVHVDDVFLPDARWNTALNCTSGDLGCNPVPALPAIRMTAADAAYARQWTQDHDLVFDMVYNGEGSEEHKEEHGSDPLAARLVADKAAYRWVNHTYTHNFLGCVQDYSVTPWECVRDGAGDIRYASQSEITWEIAHNHDWATALGLDVEPGELVTGEHSGLRIAPQQPADNPNLGPALAATGITWIASDNSRDPVQRGVGPALTVPRYPMNVFFNVATRAEHVDEYNWIYTGTADGGSGICENSPVTTCMDAPLDPVTGFSSYIVPLEARIALAHVLANDPRPHFIHQSNLSEDRIAYPVLERMLDEYTAWYTEATPLVNLGMKDIGTELRRRAAWKAAVADGQVTAYRIGTEVTVSAPDGVDVPATVPPGTTRQDTGAGFGTAYATAVSGWAPHQGALGLVLPA